MNADFLGNPPTFWANEPLWAKPGIPFPTTVLIEVKNVRHWIYPAHAELYQLLSKAANLQARFPNQRFIPVLVCRQVHYLTFQLAKTLGFVAYYMQIQPILSHSAIIASAVAEVRDELGYNLVQTADAHSGLVTTFSANLPKLALRTSERWAETAARVAPFAQRLRDPTLPHSTRRQLTRDLQATFREGGEEEEWDYDPSD